MLSTDAVDWKLANGDLVFPMTREVGVEGVAAALRYGLQLVRAELFFDQEIGFPYFERDGVTAAQAIMGQRFNQQKCVAAYRDEITRILAAIGVDGEILLLRVDFDGATRALDVRWQVGTEFGNTPVDRLSLGV